MWQFGDINPCKVGGQLYSQAAGADMPCLPQPPLPPAAAKQAACRRRKLLKRCTDGSSGHHCCGAGPVPAAANAAASSLLDLVFSTLPVPPPLPKILITWKKLLPFQSATTQRPSQDEWRKG